MRKRGREGEAAPPGVSSSSSRSPIKASLASAGMVGRHVAGAAAADGSGGSADVRGGVQCDASVLRGLQDLTGRGRVPYLYVGLLCHHP
jgi:hypothetical protein